MKVWLLPVVSAVVIVTPCLGEVTGYNIDFGPNTGSSGNPANTFGAAGGQPGYWNAVSAAADHEPVLDVGGIDVGATCTVSGGYFALNYNNLSTGGNFQKLLDDFNDTDSAGGTITVTFDGLEPGEYLVFTYALAPDGSSFRTLVNVMESTSGPEQVGGTFAGVLEAGITHALHVANVGLNEQLTISVSTAAHYASINGVQIVPLAGLAGAFGEANGDQFGKAVACIGDINSDNWDDFIVGSPYNDEQGSNSGKIYIYSGLSGEVIQTILGEAEGDQFGYAVYGAGDVNDDGTPDFIVGAPFSNQSANDAGKAYVFSGADYTTLYSIVGSSSGDRFGQAVAGGVDLNNDGFTDFFVGAPECKSQNGKLYVFSGATGEKLKTISGKKDDKLGWAIAPIPNANGDSFADFAVSSPLNDEAGSNAGKVTVYSGKNFKALYHLKGAHAGAQFGHAIACARRANADGRDDLIVGSPYFDSSGKSNRGRIDVFSGKNGVKLWSKTGSAAGDRLGWAVAGVGDVNGDGYDDVAASATYFDSTATDAGRVHVRSGLDGTSIASINGEAQGDRLASSLAGLQDPSGNGSNDILAGAPHNDINGSSSGKIYVVSFIDAAQAPPPDVGPGDPMIPIVKEFAPVVANQPNAAPSLSQGFCQGDLDLNGTVDDLDLLALIGAWGACDMCDEDLNDNGTVDSADLILLVNTWGSCQ